METFQFVSFLLATCFIFGHSVAMADDPQSLDEHISTVQNETTALCLHVEQVILPAAKNLKHLIDNAHEKCPDYQRMEPVLANVENQAHQYLSSAEKQLRGCRKLENMLINGPDNGGFLMYHLKEGDYSEVTEMTDRWHISFLNFEPSSYLVNIPIGIMMDHKKVFYHTSWSEGIRKFLLTFSLPVAFTTILTFLLVLTGKTAATIRALYQFFHRKKLTTRPIPIPRLSKEFKQDAVVDSSLMRHRFNQTAQNVEDEEISEVIDSDVADFQTSHTPIPFTFYLVVVILLWLSIFSLALSVVLLQTPNVMFIPQPVRYNWYPDATSAIDSVSTNIGNFYSKLSSLTKSVNEIRRHVNMYHDPAIHVNVSALIETVGNGLQYSAKELADAYILSANMPSTFRRAYKRIEERAMKAGRLDQATDLLVALNNSADKYEVLLHTLTVSMNYQRKILPSLKEQTRSLSALMQEGRFIELRDVLDNHQKALFNIDGQLYDVQLKVDQYLGVINDGHIDGMKRSLVSLTDENVRHQVKAMILGSLGGAGTITGMLGIKSGLAMVTVTATAVAGPLLVIGGGLGLAGLSAYYAVSKYDSYVDASLYINELDALEIERINMKNVMEQLKNATDNRIEAVETSQGWLKSLIHDCDRYSSKVRGFVLNSDQLFRMKDKLFNLATEYNRLIPVYNSFPSDVVPDDQRPRLN